MEQALWMLRLYHVSIRFTGIYTDMMLIHFDFCRDEAVAARNGIRKLFPAIFTEFSG